jgi:Protein of unknown function (DUF998)
MAMDTGIEVLGIAATALFAAAGLVLLRLHFVPTGRDPVVEAISDYGVGAYHRHYRAMVVLLGAGAVVLVAALSREGAAESGSLAFLSAFAAARLAIAFFMTDPHDGPYTTEGRVHLVLAAVAFSAIAFGSADVTSSVDGRPGWTGTIHDVMRLEARLVAVSAVATAVCYLIPAVRQRLFGGVERVLYVTSLAWLVTTAVHLAVHAA